MASVGQKAWKITRIEKWSSVIVKLKIENESLGYSNKLRRGQKKFFFELAASIYTSFHTIRFRSE